VILNKEEERNLMTFTLNCKVYYLNVSVLQPPVLASFYCFILHIMSWLMLYPVWLNICLSVCI